MSYQIIGLDPEPFQPLFELDDVELGQLGMVRMRVSDRPGFPCRVLLDDLRIGEKVLLLNHVSHDGDGPYRASHAIFVSAADRAARFHDQVPPALDRRILSLRAFDGAGLMVDAAIAEPGQADGVIRRLLADQRVVKVDAHNAIRGCFAAAITRN